MCAHPGSELGAVFIITAIASMHQNGLECTGHLPIVMPLTQASASTAH